MLVDIVRTSVRKVGLDRATIYGVLSKVWGLGAGIVTLLIVASHFSKELQGYYYTFGSLLALQTFVELGLGQVILQFASHEWSRLRLNEERYIVGDPDSLSRLASIGRFAVQWFSLAGILVTIGLSFAGLIFFSNSTQPGVNWVMPWLVLCILTGLNIYFLPFLSLIEGCNQVAELYKYRFVLGVLNSLSIWGAMLLGAKLWTGAISSAIGLLWAVLFLFRRYRNFFSSFLIHIEGPIINWRTEMLPLQWRIALSWLSGYLFSSLFTPVLFKFQGAAAAGQMGMTWGMVNALSSIALTWIFTKTPRFGMLVAQKDYIGLDKLVIRSGITAFIVACCGAIVIEGLLFVLYAIHYPLATRVLAPLPTGLFLLATLLMQISNAQSAYLRAHKKEPFMILSIACGILVSICTLILGKKYGAIGMAAGYLAVIALIGLPIGTIILLRCRANWHASTPVQ